jgi:hypothetical protein
MAFLSLLFPHIIHFHQKKTFLAATEATTGIQRRRQRRRRRRRRRRRPLNIVVEMKEFSFFHILYFPSAASEELLRWMREEEEGVHAYMTSLRKNGSQCRQPFMSLRTEYSYGWR